jgi:hypothetical protein
MGALGSKLRTIEGDQVGFWCPGCDEMHVVRVPPHPHAWGFNGNGDAPTFTPSVLTWRDANPDAAPGFEKYREAYRCHSFVTDGRIQFLGDCTHDKAGQTVELPDFPA